jgi:ABC-2 type transport system ATP-binding protein
MRISLKRAGSGGEISGYGLLTVEENLWIFARFYGLDSQVARQVRDFVQSWMAAHPDRTLLLTTHYMAEADELCDRRAIIDLLGRGLDVDTSS